jgi:hypothetical protein
MRRPRLRLITVMVIIAFLALAFTAVVQSIRLNQALVREQLVRATAEDQRARAEAEARRVQAVLEKLRQQR